MEKELFVNETIFSADNNTKIENANITVPSENNEVKYYGNEDANCNIKISEDKEQEELINVNSQKAAEKLIGNGKIEVTSILDCGEHEYLQGIKINLYKINGLSPILIKSKMTDEKGQVVFSEIEDGCYRIIEIVDKRYFEKPKYINWNEIIIDNINKNQKIVIVNKIKTVASQNKYKDLI